MDKLFQGNSAKGKLRSFQLAGDLARKASKIKAEVWGAPGGLGTKEISTSSKVELVLLLGSDKFYVSSDIHYTFYHSWN